MEHWRFYLESTLDAHRSAQDVWRGDYFSFAVGWARGRGLKEVKRLNPTIFSKGNLSLNLPGSFLPWREARGSFPMAQPMHGEHGQEPATHIQGSCFTACTVLIDTAP